MMNQIEEHEGFISQSVHLHDIWMWVFQLSKFQDIYVLQHYQYCIFGLQLN